jgi:hypothetical protein
MRRPSRRRSVTIWADESGWSEPGSVAGSGRAVIAQTTARAKVCTRHPATIDVDLDSSMASPENCDSCRLRAERKGHAGARSRVAEEALSGLYSPGSINEEREKAERNAFFRRRVAFCRA